MLVCQTARQNHYQPVCVIRYVALFQRLKSNLHKTIVQIKAGKVTLETCIQCLMHLSWELYYLCVIKFLSIQFFILFFQPININTKPIKIISRDMDVDDCKALNCENGRFGFSISPVEDLDLDGYKGKCTRLMFLLCSWTCYIIFACLQKCLKPVLALTSCWSCLESPTTFQPIESTSKDQFVLIVKP